MDDANGAPAQTYFQKKSKYAVYDEGKRAGEKYEPLFRFYDEGVHDRLSEMRELYKEIEALKKDEPITKRTILKKDGESLEEQLFDACSTLKIITSEVSMHISKEAREKIFRQIDMMHDPEEWEGDNVVMDPDSYRGFLAGYMQLSPTRVPGLGVAFNGNVIAAWMDGDDKLILEFSKNEVRWVLTRRVDGEIEHMSGRSGIDRLAVNLLPNISDQHFFE